MRLLGTTAMGVRLPIISQGDNLVDIVADSISQVSRQNNITLTDQSVIGITEGIVAKAQGNYASLEDIEFSVKQQMDVKEVGVVFPILSRNRFAHMLRAFSGAYEKVYVLLDYPNDEVGNPLIDTTHLYEIEDKLTKNIYTIQEFEDIAGKYYHPFTGVNYPELFQSIGDNIEIFVSKDPRTILEHCDNIIVSNVHGRFMTQKTLEKAGAKQVICLHDILKEPVPGKEAYNPEFGLLGSNLATDTSLKLFPRNCHEFVRKVQKAVEEKTGVKPEVLVYGDGAFKDPIYGIWELSDPLVAPGYTDGLEGSPTEIKLKYLADNQLNGLGEEEKRKALQELICQKNDSEDIVNEGTTPRRYIDLLGSLCDLISGSGDKGTPVVLVQGYFDDFASC